MKILLTGGAGFIGSHLAERLLSQGATVTIVDNFDDLHPSKAKQDNLAKIQGNDAARIVELDIRDLNALRALGGPYDAIVHLAAKAGVRPSIADPVAYQQVNVYGTQNLLQFAQESGVKRFVFASSSSVYGVNPNVPWSESDYVLKPISPYASTKLSGEFLGHVYSHLHGIQFVALRLFTVYGPRQRPDLAIRKFGEQMLKGVPIQLFGDGTSTRDYTFVGDVVDGICCALDYTASNYEIFNLGNSDGVALLRLVRILERELGVTAQLNFGPSQPGDVPQTLADTEKARRLLGWRAKTSIDEGLHTFARWLGATLKAGQNHALESLPPSNLSGGKTRAVDCGSTSEL